VSVHGVIEYLAAALFIVAPFLLDYDSWAATAVSIVVGVLIIVVAALTAGPTGLVKQIPIQAHLVIDFVLVVVLIVAPFAFGFSDETNPTVFFIALGVAHLLITLATRFVRGGDAAVEPASGQPAGSARVD
jgi:hypothetical protein